MQDSTNECPRISILGRVVGTYPVRCSDHLLALFGTYLIGRGRLGPQRLGPPRWPADRTAIRYAGGSTPDLQHDLTGNARSPLGFEGLPAVLQREHLADDGPQFAGVDPPGQLRQRRPVGLDDEEDVACSRTPGLLRRGYDGDQHTSRF